jgi:hypothetical protein
VLPAGRISEYSHLKIQLRIFRTSPMSNPISTAQTARGLLAVLRRAKNVKNASDEERNALLEDAEQIEHQCAWLVLSAIVLEVVTWISPLDPSFFKAGNAISDAFVAVGILGEMRFGQVVGNILKIVLAEAVERAANAELETEKIRQRVSPRALTEEQYKALQTLKGQIDAVDIASAKAFEAIQFARQITHALTSVGIAVNPVGTISDLTYPGVAIVLPRSLKADVQEPLVKAFRLAGISVVCGNSMELPNGPLLVQTRTIFVGEKPNPYPSPPYTAGLRTPKNPATATKHIAESDP